MTDDTRPAHDSATLTRQQVIRPDGVCRCGCHGEDHRTQVRRTVRGVIYSEPFDPSPKATAAIDRVRTRACGHYVQDATGWIRYATERRRVVSRRWLFGRINADPHGAELGGRHWLLGGMADS